MAKRKRYRYILCGLVKGTDKISDFRLIAANNVKPEYHEDGAIKVEIPEDMVLEKWSCDPYSTTRDARTLDELGYDVVIWDAYNKKWNVRNDLKGNNPCDFYQILEEEKEKKKKEKSKIF